MPNNESNSVVPSILNISTDKTVSELLTSVSTKMGSSDIDSSTMLDKINSQPVTNPPNLSGWNSTEFSSSFLEHASGQGVSGVCAWAAILITCHQVKIILLPYSMNSTKSLLIF